MNQRGLRYHLLGQRGLTIWFTGLSASEGRLCYCIDGDIMRKGINSDLSYTNNDRTENIRRLGEIATILTDMGAITLVAAITPFQKDRINIRRMHERKRLPFWEVLVDCPLNVCEERDPKGLYAKARNEHPDIILHTANSTIEDCIHVLWTRIQCFLHQNREESYKLTEQPQTFLQE
ncbi:Bifunctional 3'-phosphoadenosine 5'-phosphosulfate synthase [Galdieria sulphuraria]|nr:Bifunctional 3'-phosphoadenosine 5'-phosphosulfate synthase [Galdieria sulphuraria]